MSLGIWEKIENIRSQPEHIRMRYVWGSLAISMLFILSIWLLSLHESFTIISEDTPEALEQGKEVLSGENEPSLNDLMQKNESLRVEPGSDADTTGEDFFQGQLEQKTNK
ncbi:MAG: hypothetical protein AAB615_00365 [Patescibacteria group bacterium]